MIHLTDLTLANITFTFSILCLIVRLSIQFGRFMRRFDELQERIRMHDKMLGIPGTAKFSAKPFDKE